MSLEDRIARPEAAVFPQPAHDEATWEDVEYRGKIHGCVWVPCRQYKRDNWKSDYNTKFEYRLNAKFDHQPITYAQFRVLLDNAKPASKV